MKEEEWIMVSKSQFMNWMKEFQQDNETKQVEAQRQRDAERQELARVDREWRDKIEGCLQSITQVRVFTFHSFPSYNSISKHPT